MRRLATAALVATLLGCSSLPAPRQADLFFEAGSFALAIAAYESFLDDHPTSEERQRVLFHLAVASSLITPSPELEARSPVSYLDQLLEEYPDSSYRHQAGALLGLYRELEQLRRDIAERTRILVQLLAGTSQLKADLSRLEGEKEGEIGQLDAQLEALRQRIRQRNAEIDAQQQQIARLRQELELLKKIDTGGR